MKIVTPCYIRPCLSCGSLWDSENRTEHRTEHYIEFWTPATVKGVILAYHRGKSCWQGKIWRISYNQYICQIHFWWICENFTWFAQFANFSHAKSFLYCVTRPFHPLSSYGVYIFKSRDHQWPWNLIRILGNLTRNPCKYKKSWNLNNVKGSHDFLNPSST